MRRNSSTEPTAARRYEELARRGPLVAVGVGVPVEPVPGVRGADLHPDDDLADEGPDEDRRFEFVVTHDRPIVLAAARSLMDRLVPIG